MLPVYGYGSKGYGSCRNSSTSCRKYSRHPSERGNLPLDSPPEREPRGRDHLAGLATSGLLSPFSAIVRVVVSIDSSLAMRGPCIFHANAGDCDSFE
jgi:hypothetical protein